MKNTSRRLRQIIREIADQNVERYSFLPAGVSVDDFVRVVKSRALRWTSETFGQRPLSKDSIIRALESTNDPLDKETIRFILEVYDKTSTGPDTKDVIGLMLTMELSIGLDLFDSKDSELKDILIAIDDFMGDVPYATIPYYARHSILALDPQSRFYKNDGTGSNYLKIMRDSISAISPEFFSTMHKLIDANEFFSVPHKIDPEYAERVYDTAISGFEGLEQAIELIKSLEMSY